MKNFRLSEFTCKCGCGQSLMNKDFLERIDWARDLAGVPFAITSGYRCPDHNRKVGSTSTNHVRGVAADIVCTVGPNRLKIVKALLDTGFRRLGIHRQFIHADVNEGPESIWFY